MDMYRNSLRLFPIWTGYVSEGQSQIAGQDNWTSDSSLDNGTTVALNSFWASPPASSVDPRISDLFTCDSSQLSGVCRIEVNFKKSEFV
jgi:hypothetical protein